MANVFQLYVTAVFNHWLKQLNGVYNTTHESSSEHKKAHTNDRMSPVYPSLRLPTQVKQAKALAYTNEDGCMGGSYAKQRLPEVYQKLYIF